jgi:hypothetical protein
MPIIGWVLAIAALCVLGAGVVHILERFNR